MSITWPVDLLKRQEKGSPLTVSDHDNNITTIENGLNDLHSKLETTYIIDSSPQFDVSVSDKDVVYKNPDGKYYPAISDNTDASKVIGIADLDNNIVIALGIIQTNYTFDIGDSLFLSDASAGKITNIPTDVYLGTSLGNGIILFSNNNVQLDNVSYLGDSIKNIKSYNGSLSDAINDIGSSDCTLIISEPISVTCDISIPENICLKILKGCPITVDTKPQITEKIATADGTNTSYNYTVNDPPIDKGSIEIAYTISGTQCTATDDSNGNISGLECSGTVDYKNGTIDLSFNTAPDNDTDINSTYLPLAKMEIFGSIEAGLWQVFDGNGIVTGNPKIEVVYPEWFGAKGDGVTDDTMALVSTAAFPVILLNRDKHYIVKDTLVIENSYLNLNNSLLEFQTTGSTLALQVRNNSKITNGAVLVNGNLFDSGGQYGCPIVIGDYKSGTGYSNIEVDNLLVDTNKSNGNGIMVTGNSYNIKISNIKSVSSSTIGRVVLIHWGNSDDPTNGTKHPHDIIVENVVGENLSYYDTDTSVVFISGAYNLDISNIRALDCSLRAAVISYAGDYGNYYADENIKDAIMSNIKIKNVFGRVINDNSSLIKIDHKSTSAPTNNILPGCYIQNCYGKGNGSSCTQSGINISNCKGGIIENCRVKGFVNGLVTGESVIRLHIKGGEYYNNYNHGIRLHNGTAPPEHCIVEGVKAYANGLDTNGYYAGIFVGISKHCIAKDNVVGELNESSQAYGIRVDNAAVGAVIVDNHCLGATTVVYSIGAGTTYEVCKEFHGNTVDDSVTVPVQAGVNPQIVHTLYRGNYKKRVCLGSNVPLSGSWNTPDIIYDESPAGGGYLGWVCVRSGEAAPTWTASTSKNVGDKVVPTTDNGHYYECTVAGTTGSSEPTWPTNVGETVTDGDITWECKGTAALFKEFGQISS